MSLQDLGSNQNSAMFSEVMKVATKVSLDRYHARGIPPKFGTDIVSEPSDVSLDEWTSDDHPLAYVYDSSSKVHELRSPVMMGDGFVMVKTWSLARAFEYLYFFAMQIPGAAQNK